MTNPGRKYGGVQLDGVLAQRVNHEPLIFRGLTSSELNILFIGAILFWLPVSLIIGALFFSPTIMIGFSFALTIVTVFFGASIFQRVKRNRPDGFYAHKIALMLEKLSLKKSGFDLPEGVMSLGRSINCQDLRR